VTAKEAPREELEKLIVEVARLRFLEKNLCLKLYWCPKEAEF
jgi:hypothetical protein